MPGNKQVHKTALDAAYRHRWDNRWADAEQAFQRALTEFPDDVVARQGLGFCYMQLKQWQKALTEYETALKLDQNNTTSLNKVAELYAILNRHDDAYAAYLRLADLCAGDGQKARAENALQKAAQLFPAKPAPSPQEKQSPTPNKANFSIDDLIDPNALPSWMQGELPEKPAVSRQSQLILRNPEAEAPLPSKSRRPYRPRELEEPVPPLVPRRRTTAEQIPGLLKQAELLQTQGRTIEAINVCKQIGDGGFNRPDVQYFLGWLYQQIQRWDDAILHFQSLLKDPDYALSCYYALGQCYREKSYLRTAAINFDEAVDRVNLNALTIDEADQLLQLYQETAEAHKAIGEQKQALKVYQSLLSFLRSRHWDSHVSKVELLLQGLQPPPRRSAGREPISPPANAVPLSATPLDDDLQVRAEDVNFHALFKRLEDVFPPEEPRIPRAVPAAPTPLPAQVPGNNQSQESLSSTQLPANTILKGRYRILERLGKGGMGAVYKAKDADLNNRFVAVKQMRQHGLAPHLLTMYTDIFKSEANLLAMLMHPNLPRIYDHFFEGESWYLVMDYIDGRNLQAHLEQSGGRLPIVEALRIACDLCTVLDYLHQQQPPIIFRDLKPSNVMLTQNGHLYLIDFGIARQFKPEQLKDTHHFQTVGYAAPEQFSQKATTPRSDIYSLGATLHQLLSGNDPAESAFDFSPLQVDIPALTTLVQQMLQMRPADRPASMAIVKQELQRMLSQVQSNPPLVPIVDALTLTSLLNRTAYLHIVEGKGAGSCFELHNNSTSIGRTSECDIVLEDLAVSRLHLTIYKNNNGYTAKDEGGVNGINRNGQSINSHQSFPLHEGDRIQAGQTILLFSYHPSARSPLLDSFVL